MLCWLILILWFRKYVFKIIYMFIRFLFFLWGCFFINFFILSWVIEIFIFNFLNVFLLLLKGLFRFYWLFVILLRFIKIVLIVFWIWKMSGSWLFINCVWIYILFLLRFCLFINFLFFFKIWRRVFRLLWKMGSVKL